MPISRRRLARALVALALVTGVGCSASEEDPANPDRSPETQSSDDDGISLTYLRGRRLVRLAVATGEETVLGRVSVPDVHPIPGRSDRFLIVEDRGGGEDFAQDPVLGVIDETGGMERTIGTGFGPLVDPAGTKVAYLRSAGGRTCEGEVCLGSVTLEVADLESGESDRVLPAGDWHPLAWAGDDLILSATGRAERVSLSGRSEPIDAVPSEIWGTTPDGDEMLVVRGDGTVLQDMETGDARPLDVRGLLAEGEWSPDGSRLVAVTVRGGRTELVHISADDGSVTPVPDSDDAVGPILWAEDGSFLFVRAVGLRLEAVLCAEIDTCRPILEWAEGVTPLSLR